MGDEIRRNGGAAGPAVLDTGNAEEGATSAPETAWDALGAELENEKDAWDFGGEEDAVAPARESEVEAPDEEEDSEEAGAEEEADEDAEEEEESEEEESDEDAEEAEEEEAEAEEEEEAEEGEEEESEEEPEDRGLPPAAIKAIKKARKRAQVAEAERNELRPRLQALEGELTQLRAARVVPQATPENPLAEYNDAASLDGFEQRLEGLRDWLDLNPDGGEYTWPNGQKLEIEPEHVRSFQVKLRKDLERNIPKRREYFEKRAGVDAHLEKLYPVLKDPNHPLSLGVNRALAAMPALKNLHTARADALLYTLGAELLKAHQGREAEVLRTLEGLRAKPKGPGAEGKVAQKRKPKPGVKAKPVPAVRSRGPKRTKPKPAGNRAGAMGVADEIDVSDWENEL